MKSMCPILSLVSASLWIASHAVADDAKKVDFVKDIQPILLKSCIQCHGPEKQKGKLRLDSKADAFKSSDVIVAGKADESDLYKRITLPAGHDDVMPNEGQPLTKAQ